MSKERTPFAIGNISDDGRIVPDASRIKATWDDGTKHEEALLDKIDGRWHLRVRGTTKDGNCQSYQFPVEFTPEGDIEPAVDATDAQRCTGIPCTFCKFRPGGGCTCNDMDMSHMCNHSTGSLTEALPVFLKADPTNGLIS